MYSFPPEEVVLVVSDTGGRDDLRQLSNICSSETLYCILWRVKRLDRDSDSVLDIFLWSVIAQIGGQLFEEGKKIVSTKVGTWLPFIGSSWL